MVSSRSQYKHIPCHFQRKSAIVERKLEIELRHISFINVINHIFEDNINNLSD